MTSPQSPVPATSTSTGAAVAAAIAANIRARRRELDLTVTELAERSGVSRRTMTVIESGSGNASLSTIDSIATALGMSFVDLVRPRDEQRLEVVTGDESTVMWSRRADRGRLFTSSSSAGVAELWDWRLGPRGRYDARADRPGTEELLFVVEGQLTLHVDQEHMSDPENVSDPSGEAAGSQDRSTVIVDAGSAVRFATDRPYRYVNDGSGPLWFVRIVVTRPDDRRASGGNL